MFKELKLFFILLLSAFLVESSLAIPSIGEESSYEDLNSSIFNSRIMGGCLEAQTQNALVGLFGSASQFNCNNNKDDETFCRCVEMISSKSEFSKEEFDNWDKKIKDEILKDRIYESVSGALNSYGHFIKIAKTYDPSLKCELPMDEIQESLKDAPEIAKIAKENIRREVRQADSAIKYFKEDKIRELDSNFINKVSDNIINKISEGKKRRISSSKISEEISNQLYVDNSIRDVLKDRESTSFGSPLAGALDTLPVEDRFDLNDFMTRAYSKKSNFPRLISRASFSKAFLNTNINPNSDKKIKNLFAFNQVTSQLGSKLCDKMKKDLTKSLTPERLMKNAESFYNELVIKDNKSLSEDKLLDKYELLSHLEHNITNSDHIRMTSKERMEKSFDFDRFYCMKKRNNKKALTTVASLDAEKKEIVDTELKKYVDLQEQHAKYTKKITQTHATIKEIEGNIDRYKGELSEIQQERKDLQSFKRMLSAYGSKEFITKEGDNYVFKNFDKFLNSLSSEHSRFKKSLEEITVDENGRYVISKDAVDKLVASNQELFKIKTDMIADQHRNLETAKETLMIYKERFPAIVAQMEKRESNISEIIGEEAAQAYLGSQVTNVVITTSSDGTTSSRNLGSGGFSGLSNRAKQNAALNRLGNNLKEFASQNVEVEKVAESNATASFQTASNQSESASFNNFESESKQFDNQFESERFNNDQITQNNFQNQATSNNFLTNLNGAPSAKTETEQVKQAKKVIVDSEQKVASNDKEMEALLNKIKALEEEKKEVKATQERDFLAKKIDALIASQEKINKENQDLKKQINEAKTVVKTAPVPAPSNTSATVANSQNRVESAPINFAPVRNDIPRNVPQQSGEVVSNSNSVSAPTGNSQPRLAKSNISNSGSGSRSGAVSGDAATSGPSIGKFQLTSLASESEDLSGVQGINLGEDFESKSVAEQEIYIQGLLDKYGKEELVVVHPSVGKVLVTSKGNKILTAQEKAKQVANLTEEDIARLPSSVTPDPRIQKYFLDGLDEGLNDGIKVQ